MTSGDVIRSMFDQALTVLDDERASETQRFVAEEALASFMHALEHDERCVTDLLAYVARTMRRPLRSRCRRAYVAAAALRAISEPDRAFATACRILQWASAADDGDTIAYLLQFHFASHLGRCDVDPALLERGYDSLPPHSRISYLARLVASPTKDERSLRRFCARELPGLDSNTPRFYEHDLRKLREFTTSGG